VRDNYVAGRERRRQRARETNKNHSAGRNLIESEANRARRVSATLARLHESKARRRPPPKRRNLSPRRRRDKDRRRTGASFFVNY
jgi:hypothetical protein